VIAVAAALYLFDCVVLLERGQALWSHRAMSFGSKHYQIGGKVVALLNPLTPFLTVLRTRPLLSRSSNVKASKALHTVAPLWLLSLFQLLIVFVALPYCLYRAPGWPFFVSLLLAYLNAIVLLGVIGWRFRKAGFASRPLFGLGFAWLACLPLSVNAQRKAGLVFDVAMDARQAIRALPARQRERARRELAAQVAEALQDLDDDDEQRRRLADLQRELSRQAGA
jgi:hypothetical protein